MRPPAHPARLGILLSGRGSNFAAIADAIAIGELPALISVVISNRPDAPGLDRARERGLPTVTLPSRGREREPYDLDLVACLRHHHVEWVCLAGYMRLLSGVFLSAFPRRIVNIHPSLLPAFPGLDAQRQAVDYGVKFSGCTVHLVDETLDGGPILAQSVVPVLETDTSETLAARILEEEHRLYPAALRRLLTSAES